MADLDDFHVETRKGAGSVPAPDCKHCFLIHHVILHFSQIYLIQDPQRQDYPHP